MQGGVLCPPAFREEYFEWSPRQGHYDYTLESWEGGVPGQTDPPHFRRRRGILDRRQRAGARMGSNPGHSNAGSGNQRGKTHMRKHPKRCGSEHRHHH